MVWHRTGTQPITGNNNNDDNDNDDDNNYNNSNNENNDSNNSNDDNAPAQYWFQIMAVSKERYSSFD